MVRKLLSSVVGGHQFKQVEKRVACVLVFVLEGGEDGR